jgi:hypothetical protein
LSGVKISLASQALDDTFNSSNGWKFGLAA